MEGKTDRTGLIFATPGAAVVRIDPHAATATPAVDLSLEARLSAATPLTDRPVDRVLPLTLAGDMTAYIWSLNGGIGRMAGS